MTSPAARLKITGMAKSTFFSDSRTDERLRALVCVVVSGVTFHRYDGVDQDDRRIWTTPAGDRVAWFLDPDGHTLSLTAFA